MNAEQMVLALNAFGALIGGNEAVILSKFAQVFSGMGDVTATAVATQVAKNWKTEKRAPRRPAELEKVLRRIEATLAATGAKTQAAVFTKLLSILAGNDNQTVDDFVRDAIAARVEKPAPQKPPRPVKPQKVAFADLVPDLARELSAAMSNRTRFDALLKDYDQRYTKPGQLKQIAERFMGYPVDRMKRPNIVKAMHNWQREEELHRNNHALQAKVGL